MAANSDDKMLLTKLCQRVAGRAMSRNDIKYSHEEYDSQYQAMVTLVCHGSSRFAGMLSADVSTAENEAAKQAIVGLTEEMEQLAAQLPKPARPVPPLDVKNKLREAVKQVLGRELFEADVAFTISQKPAGFQAVLKLPSLSEWFGNKFWTGSVTPYKLDTILQAAQVALHSLFQHQELCRRLPTERHFESKGKGKAKGKGKMDGKGVMFPPVVKGKGKGWDVNMQMLWTMGWAPMMGGSHDNGPKFPSGPDLPRRRVSEEEFVGEVTDWKVKYGWIKPASEIKHESMSNGRGRVYMSMNDLPQGVSELAAGARVKFKVYTDTSGSLGAEQVELL